MLQDNYRAFSVRSAAILTGSYVAGTVLEGLDQYNQLILQIDFTKGSLTTMDLKVEFSPDGTNYYQETASAVSGGTSTETLLLHQYSATGAYRLAIPLKDSFVKVSVIGNGTATSSSCAIRAIVGSV